LPKLVRFATQQDRVHIACGPIGSEAQNHRCASNKQHVARRPHVPVQVAEKLNQTLTIH